MSPLILDEPYSFESQPNKERRRSISAGSTSNPWAGIALCDLYVGAAAQVCDDGSGCVEVGLSIHDGTYSVDFCVHRICPASKESVADALKMSAKDNIDRFCEEHHGKFVGAGITTTIVKLCPDIAAFMWRELDVAVMAFDVETEMPSAFSTDGAPIQVGVDEQADSAVRKAITNYGPHNMPALSIGFRNRVEVDNSGRIELVHSLDEYEKTVSKQTWQCVMNYVNELKKEKVKIAFFSATPQGGGVALMRHALIRFLRLAGVNASWYIPKPNPKVFRITKTNHNILQGVAAPDARFGPEQQKMFNDWINYNATRYWLSPGGPLAAGGADVVIIDDPQMPGLIPLIKETRPEVKIIYRSHIEIRSDLVEIPGSPQEEVWHFLWERIKQADVFISHPVNSFVPRTVPVEIVGLMPAATDWLDGLNKPMRDWDLRYYHHMLRNECHNIGMNRLDYPQREYIVQIARFDPSKGLPTVLDGYRKLRALYAEKSPGRPTPQLLVCGHGAIDDPDASIIYDEVLEHLDGPDFDDIRADIVVMRLGPSDQLLDALITTAKIVWQLSSREGFEVKVSEALHKGKPVIATRAGGIPLQVRDGHSGYLVKVGDSDAVAQKSYELLNDEKKLAEMGQNAKNSVSDEVGTVGNAVAWMFLAAKLARGDKLKPNTRWIADMVREEVGCGWGEEEVKLPRGGLKVVGGTEMVG
ncbi:hypothetical protein EDC01DRAFT_722835 [Geopyxis carbonaria]|nr:hypothetical protein EDC01DRAFT_722835 [Geopyxis carbonaria]